MDLICPLCGELLTKTEHSLSCPNRHGFDIARQGYVNLLPVQNKRSLAPGDTREQVLSRRRFLESGAYAPIADALIHKARELGCAGPILDVGCGEGWYSAQLAGALGCRLTGLDISKEAVRCAAGKYKDAQWLCASAAHIPVPDHSAGLLTSLFAVTLPGEFRRVLAEQGYFFQVLAAEDHLTGLKSIIYDRLTHKEKDSVPELPGFRLVSTQTIRFPLRLEGEAIRDLFSMTPHVYRVSKAGYERLMNTQALADEASCVLNVYVACP